MNKIFFYISLFFITLSLIIVIISVLNIELLISWNYLSYSYTILFIIFFLSIFSISKKGLHKSCLKENKLLNIGGLIGLIYGCIFIYTFFEEDVFFKNGKYYQINGRNSILIDKTFFLIKFRIQTIENSIRILFFSYAVFLINFLILKGRKV